MDDVVMWMAIALLFGGGLVCFIARLHFCRFGVVWWAGVAMSLAGFLGMLAVGMLFPA